MWQIKIHCQFIDWILRMRAPQRKSTQTEFTLIFFFFLSIWWLHLPLFLLLSLSRSSVVSPWQNSRNGQKAAETEENQLQTAESQNSYFRFVLIYFHRFSLRWMNEGKAVHKSIRRLLSRFCSTCFFFSLNFLFGVLFALFEPRLHVSSRLHCFLDFILLFFFRFVFFDSLVVVQFSLWILFSLLCYLFVCVYVWVSVCFAFDPRRHLCVFIWFWCPLTCTWGLY